MGFLMLDWPAPRNIKSVVSTRYSLGEPVTNWSRSAFQQQVRSPNLCWLKQVHGTTVLNAKAWQPEVEADACWTASPGQACVVLTADCLPVLFCNDLGTEVAAVHAGWRGLAAGILEVAIAKFSAPRGSIMAYIGPHIGAKHFEVGEDVKDGMRSRALPGSVLDAAFEQRGSKYMANLNILARAILGAQGVNRVYGGELCSIENNDLFYSYRKEGVTGRNASAIWIDDTDEQC